MALQKAQTTAIYAGLQLWPSATTAALVRSQLTEDGTYPGAVAAFEAAGDVSGAQRTVADFDPAQPRDDQGRWTNGGVGSGSPGAEPASASKPAPAEHGSGVGTLGAVLSQFNPVSSAAAEEAHPTKAAPLVVATHIHEDPINPEPPEDEQEKQTQERLKELDDPIRGGPRGRPDGTLAVPAPGVPFDQTPAAVTRGFAGKKSVQTWQNQMINRGWTAQQIEEAATVGERYPAENRVNPGNGATRYVHPTTGRSVVIDDTTGQVIQVGGGRFGHER